MVSQSKAANHTSAQTPKLAEASSCKGDSGNYFNSIALIKLYALLRSWWMKTFVDTVDDDGGPGLGLFYLIDTVEVKAPHS